MVEMDEQANRRHEGECPRWQYLDVVWLEGLGCGEKVFLRDMFSLFAQQCAEVMSLLSQEDLLGVPNLVGLLHRLRGSASAVGVRGVIAPLAALEARLREGRFDAEGQSLRAEVSGELRGALLEMEVYLAE